MTSTSINDLPDEVLEFIFGHMPPYGDLESCALVCKRWTIIVRSKLMHNFVDGHGLSSQLHKYFNRILY